MMTIFRLFTGSFYTHNSTSMVVLYQNTLKDGTFCLTLFLLDYPQTQLFRASPVACSRERVKGAKQGLVGSES
jgi:hypothetical protein